MKVKDTDFFCFQHSFLISLRMKQLFAYALKLREKQENPYRIDLEVRWYNRTKPRSSNHFYHKPMGFRQGIKTIPSSSIVENPEMILSCKVNLSKITEVMNQF